MAGQQPPGNQGGVPWPGYAPMLMPYGMAGERGGFGRSLGLVPDAVPPRVRGCRGARKEASGGGALKNAVGPLFLSLVRRRSRDSARDGRPGIPS